MCFEGLATPVAGQRVVLSTVSSGVGGSWHVCLWRAGVRMVFFDNVYWKALSGYRVSVSGALLRSEESLLGCSGSDAPESNRALSNEVHGTLP